MTQQIWGLGCVVANHADDCSPTHLHDLGLLHNLDGHPEASGIMHRQAHRAEAAHANDLPQRIARQLLRALLCTARSSSTQALGQLDTAKPCKLSQCSCTAHGNAMELHAWGLCPCMQKARQGQHLREGAQAEVQRWQGGQ